MRNKILLRLTIFTFVVLFISSCVFETDNSESSNNSSEKEAVQSMDTSKFDIYLKIENQPELFSFITERMITAENNYKSPCELQSIPVPNSNIHHYTCQFQPGDSTNLYLLEWNPDGTDLTKVSRPFTLKQESVKSSDTIVTSFDMISVWKEPAYTDSLFRGYYDITDTSLYAVEVLTSYRSDAEDLEYLFIGYSHTKYYSKDSSGKDFFKTGTSHAFLHLKFHSQAIGLAFETGSSIYNNYALPDANSAPGEYTELEDLNFGPKFSYTWNTYKNDTLTEAKADSFHVFSNNTYYYCQSRYLGTDTTDIFLYASNPNFEVSSVLLNEESIRTVTDVSAIEVNGGRCTGFVQVNDTLKYQINVPHFGSTWDER